MASLAQQSLDSAAARVKLMRNASEKIMQRDGSIYGSARAGHGNFSQLGNLSESQRFYRALRDLPHTAIRPIVQRFAQQPIRVAVTPTRMAGRTGMIKSLRTKGFIGESYESRQKQFRERMPMQIKEMLSPDAVVVDDHMILEAFRRPNNLHSTFDILYLLSASIMTAGRALLTWDEVNPTAGPSGFPSPSIYYIPMHWAEPTGDPASDPWRLTPPGGEPDVLNPGEFIYMSTPDPEDPLGALSPMRANARAINTADKIHDVHYHSLENLMRPSYAVIAGRLPDQNGGPNGPRPVLKKDARRQLREAIKREVAGAGRRGDPLILDGFIEDIRDLGSKPTDLDYAGGSALIESRVMQGFGTSPIVAGFSQSANRAGSITAHEIFYDLVLNPLITSTSGALSRVLGPKYSSDQFTVTVYIEQAAVKDPDSVSRRVALFRDRLSDSEARRYLRTGELEIEDDDDTFRQEQAERVANSPLRAPNGQPG